VNDVFVRECLLSGMKFLNLWFFDMCLLVRSRNGLLVLFLCCHHHIP